MHYKKKKKIAMKTAKRNLNNVEMSIKDHIWRLFRKAVICSYTYCYRKKNLTNINMFFFLLNFKVVYVTDIIWLYNCILYNNDGHNV